MRKRLCLLCIALLLLSSFAGAEGAALVDDRGAAIPATAPQRVVSLYGSYAEAWAQAGGTLVGATEDAVSERGMDLGTAQIIGTTKEPNLERILALDPDLVLLSLDIAAQVSAAEVLEVAGVPCAAFRVDTWQDYARMMDVFTALTGRRDLYEAIVPPMEAAIAQTIASAQAQNAPTVLLLRAYSTGVKAKADDNLAGAMLEDLGCVNIAAREPSLLEELTLEAIVVEDPDCIFISVMGGDEEAALAVVEETLGQNPAWQGLTAVKEGRVYVLPRDLFHYKPNARWAESYAFLYELLFEA
ncbi:MAG TPA: ABC transporter substrate-binding protein [Candidatus Pullichristensenella excrementipullorum]|nr:ABC transporter substrate-binding protein [Candidatus Pullichristensenella excrementipullorum]